MHVRLQQKVLEVLDASEATVAARTGHNERGHSLPVLGHCSEPGSQRDSSSGEKRGLQASMMTMREQIKFWEAAATSSVADPALERCVSELLSLAVSLRIRVSVTDSVTESVTDSVTAYQSCCH